MMSKTAFQSDPNGRELTKLLYRTMLTREIGIIYHLGIYPGQTLNFVSY